MQQSISQNTRHGFTLIELLIVVAIIAILAAIAVPNFLEAQTRAKISSVRSDMRTLTVPLEAYFVDHNEYVYYGWDGTVPAGSMYQPSTADIWWCPFNMRLIPLTTPIAYISALPEDPFQHRVAQRTGPDYGEDPLLKTYMYARGDMHLPAGGSTGPVGEAWSVMSRHGKAHWDLVSAGPDNDILHWSYWTFDEVMFFDEGGASDYVGPVYNATNGTTSWGEIYRWNDVDPDKG